MSQQVRDALGSDNAKLYTSVAAIMIESAAPYTAMGILFLPFYARGNNVVVAMGQVWSKLTVSRARTLSENIIGIDLASSAFARK